MYPADLQATITNARDFEATKLKANHVQAINLVMNKSSELDSKLKQFIATIVVNKVTLELAAEISNSEPLFKLRSLSTTLHSNSTTTNIPNSNTSHLPATAISDISATTNSNPITPFNPNSSQNYLSLLVASEDASTNNDLETSPRQTINNNIPPATITNDKLLAAIFFFEIKGLTKTPLFSGAALDTKPITAMYTNTKIDGQAIKLILDSGHQVDHAASARIITANGATKTLIGEIDKFSIEVNGIIVLIKILKLQLSQNGQHTRVLVTCGYFKTTTTTPLIEFEEEEKKPTWKAYQVLWADTNHNKLLPILSWDNKRKRKEENKPQEDITNKITSGWESSYSTDTRPEPLYIPLHFPSWKFGLCLTKTTECGSITIANHVTMNATATQNVKTSGTMNHVLLMANNCSMKGCETTFLVKKEPAMHYVNTQFSLMTGMVNAKIEDALLSEILEIKNNSLEPIKVVLIPNAFLDIETGPEKFHDYYQNLALIQKEQEQYLEKINTQLCDHCLIPCDFQYCNKCDFIYNPTPYRIYIILEEKEPISSCTSELDSTFNPNLNPNDDNNNETKTSNKGKQRLKQYSRTTPNTPTLQKTTAKHLQTPEQGTSVKLPLSITPFPILLENESNYSESLESKETESEPEEIPENKEEMATAYIAKIPEFTDKDNDTSPQEWLDKVQKAGDANGWIAARMLKAILYFLQGTAEEWFENLEEPFENWQTFKDAFLQQFTNNNTSITLRNCFHNIKQETSESFIARLKDKLIKKVCPHAPADLATVIRHAKSYEIAIKEANHTKLLKATSQTNNNSNNNHKDINPHNDATKTILDHHPTTNLKIVIIVEFQGTGNEIVGNYKETNKTEVINVTLHYNNLITNLYHQLIIHQNHNIKTVTIHQLHNQCSNNISNLYQFNHIRHHPLNNIKYQQEDWFNITNPHSKINCRITTTESIQITSCYLTIPEESDFQQTVLFEGEIAAPRSNSFNYTIPPAQIAQNANLSDIFPFEFEANKSPFLLSNAAVNEQKAITAMYTKATVEGKPIRLILDSGSAGSIITYQLIQQLKRNIDRPAQTVIVTADGIKKTPVGEIDDFPFSIDGIIIPVKVLVMDAPQYQALVGNDWLLKANANLNWKTQELKISYQGQYTIVPATCEKALVFEFEEKKEMPLTETYMALGSTSNWKQPLYIPLKCKDCNKKLSSMEACIFPEEEYETRTCYFCKACHREQFGSPKRNGK
ncbi:hypothetical protein G9A89_004378 [Geosiphon pyriformis]|nr:hypothetical protein G9A89_004378 [Geosiphon pyriformis]